jgi:FlaA1/EpsC-like NDP-sugar epimerase
MGTFLRNPNFYLMIFLDAFLVGAAYMLAFLLRFEGQVPQGDWAHFRDTLPYIIPLKLIFFALFGLYRGMWRYTSLMDLLNIVRTTLIASAGLALFILVNYHFRGFPRSIFVLDGILTFVLVGGARAAIRLVLTEKRKTWKGLFRIFSSRTRNESRRPRKRVLIIGAGNTGEKMLREIQENSRLNYEVVGFLDDNQGKKGRRIHGVPVLGSVSRIMDLAYNDEMDEILIAMPSAPAQEMRRIAQLCDATGLKCRTTPALGELIDGKVSIKTVREISFEDLVVRDEVKLDQEEIARAFRQKRVLVTGAGGSVGSELIRQICRFRPLAVGLVEMNELNLYRMEMECRQRFPYVKAYDYLVDIRRREALNRTFREFRPQVVFHAAAYKHVPIQERYPWEAVYNNVIGSRNLVEVSLEAKVERFVLVSSDKAVRPANVMGATKRLAEMMIEGYNGNSRTRFMAVRFGNVLGSSGSVIPLFQEQIARGGPVTVTHPDMTRYFMSVSEAAQLILQAGAMGQGGEIFILDMGKPVRILDMARDLIRLHGYEPEVDIPIQFIGLRPGEKLYEELITEGEGIVNTTHKKIMVLRGHHTWEPGPLNEQVDELLSITRNYDCPSIKHKLQELIPDYTPQL